MSSLYGIIGVYGHLLYAYISRAEMRHRYQQEMMEDEIVYLRAQVYNVQERLEP